MVSQVQREEIGCVGAMLYYPNDTVQHAGVIIGRTTYVALVCDELQEGTLIAVGDPNDPYTHVSIIP